MLSLLLLPACRNKLVQITYALANVYDDSPDLEVRVTDEHRARAEEMMACVESGDVTRLREAFLEVRANARAGSSSVVQRASCGSKQQATAEKGVVGQLQQW
jgi:hypothetical protein